MKVYQVKKKALTDKGAVMEEWVEENEDAVQEHGWLWVSMDQDKFMEENPGWSDQRHEYPELNMEWYKSVATGHIYTWDHSEIMEIRKSRRTR